MAQANKRAKYSLHYIFSLELGSILLLGSMLETWLIARADTHPSVYKYVVGGPVFSYEAVNHRKGATPLTTTVPLTVYDAQERRGYWDVFDDRGATLGREFDIKRAHAELAGDDYQVFTTTYFEDHIIERKNPLQRIGGSPELSTSTLRISNLPFD